MTGDASQAGDPGAGNAGTQLGVGLGTQNADTTTSQAGSQTGSGPTSSGSGGNDPWYKASNLDADNLKAMETHKWTDLNSVVKSFREAQSALSSRQNAPQAPSSPTEYKFNIPTDLKQGYNAEFADGFRNWAHKRGLSQEMAAGLHDDFVTWARENMSAQMQAATEGVEQTVIKAKVSLEKVWGSQGTPEFNRNLEMAKRSINQLDADLMQELRDAGVLAKVGNQEFITKPAIFKALAKVGNQLYAEDTLYGSAAASDKNPFAKETENIAMQSHIMKNDPARAKLLIRAAGKYAETIYRDFLTS